MRIHAIRTGWIRIKASQVRGVGRGLRRRLRIFADPQWTDWLPTYAWMIDHPECIIVVDTGHADSDFLREEAIRWFDRPLGFGPDRKLAMAYTTEPPVHRAQSRAWCS